MKWHGLAHMFTKVVHVYDSLHLQDLEFSKVPSGIALIE